MDDYKKQMRKRDVYDWPCCTKGARRGLADEDFNAWLAMLPDDDWDDEFERGTPIRWDSEKGWVLGNY
jgi:hypothetical protein